MNTFSIVVETENLGMAGLSDLETSLDSIQKQKFPIQKVKEVVLLVGSHVSEDIRKHLKTKYPWLTLHAEKEGLEYTKAKMRGAEIATGKYVIFADSDMNYEPTWLGNIIETIERYPKGYIVSGDTRLETKSAYRMSLNSTWMIQILSDKIKEPVPTSYFPLNNFAIERKVILETPIPYTIHLYRNKIPIWEKMLTDKGCKILRAPGTRGFHAPPGTLIDWWYRLLIYGSDFVAMMDFSLNEKGEVSEKRNMPGRIFHLLFLFPWKIEQLILNSYKLLKEDPRRIRYLPGSLLLGLANSIVAELGALFACINRDFVFNKITTHEEVHIV